MRTLFKLFLLFFCIQLSAQQLDSTSSENQTSSIPTDSSQVNINEIKDIFKDSIKPIDSTNIVSLQKKNSIIYPPNFKDYRRLGYDTGLYICGAVAGFCILWAMPESVTNWDKETIKEKGILWKWKQNVKIGPVWDKDNWVLNYVTHPYFGGIYYMTARSSGFTVLESFTYSAIMSTFFWEYGIEAFAEIPSTQDLFVTPILGSVVGEGFFYVKKSIVKHDKKILKSRFLGITTLLLIDPFNTILDGFGYKEKVKTQMNVAPVGFDVNSSKTIWGVNFYASF